MPTCRTTARRLPRYIECHGVCYRVRIYRQGVQLRGAFPATPDGLHAAIAWRDTVAAQYPPARVGRPAAAVSVSYGALRARGLCVCCRTPSPVFSYCLRCRRIRAARLAHKRQ